VDFEKHHRELPGQPTEELQHTPPESYLANPIRYKRFPATDEIDQEMLDYWEEGSAIIQQELSIASQYQHGIYSAAPRGRREKNCFGNN
jgi:hypothetical protein